MAKIKVLNKKQIQAVKHGKGPLLIIAGAGTGKTTVVTERVKHFISKGLAKPEEILALTFTEKAAREMEERIDVALPYGYFQTWISTFHSFCDRVLKNEALNIGLDPGFRLLTEAESIMFLDHHIFDFELDYFRPRGNPKKFIQGMLNHFNRLKDEDIDPDQYLKFANTNEFENQKEHKKIKELAQAFLQFEQLKAQESVMDFSDLISNALRLFRQKDDVLQKYRKKFKYILVDEFQDTNIAQNELAILLAGDKQNLTCVCDDDQAIYRWRGAAISNIIQFKKRFPKVKIVSLTKNYRSTQEILNRAYDLIQYNNPDRLEKKEGINKKLISQRRIKGEKIEFLFAERVEDEADQVAKLTNQLVEEGKYDWKDIAILVRANNHANPFIRSFARNSIPFQFLGPGQLFHQEEIKDLIAYLKILGDVGDSVAMHRILSMNILKIPARDLAIISSRAKRLNRSIFEICETLAGKSPNEYQGLKASISDTAKGKLEEIVSMIHKHLELIFSQTAGQLLYLFLEDSGLLQAISDYKSQEKEREAQNVAKFFDKLKTFESENQDASIGAALDWLTMKMELGESPLSGDTDWTQENRVNILTAHSSKGLEFPIVFLVNLVSQRFPTRERKEKIPIPDQLIKEILPEGNAHQQEERRLFYVAMTRAQDLLFMTASKYYGEGKREKRISPFVIEALGKTEEALRKKGKVTREDQLSIFDWKQGKIDAPKAKSTKINYLSYSQIGTFEICPLQYRYKYLLRIPVPQSHAQSFGISLHNTLAEFYSLHKQNKEPKKKDLLQTLKDNWQSQGYSGKSHEAKAYSKARKMLENFFDKAYDPKQDILAIEEIFKVPVSSKLWLGGRIDRIDNLGGRQIEIIDYKTGSPPKKDDSGKSLQLTSYALAVSNQGTYKRKPENIQLSFFYLEGLEKQTTKRTQSELKQAKSKVSQIKNKIEASDFNPTPGPWCDFCDFKIICPAWR